MQRNVGDYKRLTRRHIAEDSYVFTNRLIVSVAVWRSSAVKLHTARGVILQWIASGLITLMIYMNWTSVLTITWIRR
jgi:hypothetical protein